MTCYRDPLEDDNQADECRGCGERPDRCTCGIEEAFEASLLKARTCPRCVAADRRMHERLEQSLGRRIAERFNASLDPFQPYGLSSKDLDKLVSMIDDEWRKACESEQR